MSHNYCQGSQNGKSWSFGISALKTYVLDKNRGGQTRDKMHHSTALGGETIMLRYDLTLERLPGSAFIMQILN